MRRIRLLLLTLIVALVFGGCTAAEGQQPPAKTKKVLVVGIDGGRIGVLQAVDTPHLDALARNGLLCDSAGMRMPTISGPGWSNMLTGVWPDKHGVTGNDFRGKNYDEYPDFLTRIEAVRPELSTFAVADWPQIVSALGGGPLISDSIDVKFFFNADQIGSYAEADARSVEAAAHYLAAQDPDAAFVYLGTPDVVAHRLGPLTPAYRAALRAADRQIGTLVEAIESRPTYEEVDWLILVCTDHGHVDEGGHGGASPEERTIFYLASGPSVVSGCPEETPEQVDVAVTALAHLGLAIDSTWNLDGDAFGLRHSP